MIFDSAALPGTIIPLEEPHPPWSRSTKHTEIPLPPIGQRRIRAKDPYALCHINWTYHIIKGGEYRAWCHYHSEKNCCEVNVKAQGKFELGEDVTGSAISSGFTGGEWTKTDVKIW